MVVRNHTPKGKRVADVVDEIVELRERIKKDTERLKMLESIVLPGITPEPEGFDYKEAIMRLFRDKPTAIWNIDDIVAAINAKEGFVPNRNTVAIRVGYLADSAKPIQLERVEGKRGFYRLPTKPAGSTGLG